MAPLRPFLFWCILIALLAVCAEGGSFIVISSVEGQWYSLADVDIARSRRAEDFLKMSVDDDVNADAEKTDFPLVLHPYLGFSFKPPAREEITSETKQITLYGLAPGAGEIIHEPGSNMLVIGVLGGSVASNFVIRGAGVQALKSALLRDPRLAGKDIRFTSMALPGGKEPQQIIALNYFLSLGAHLDLVINLSGFNEATFSFSENVPVGLHPLYPRGWHVLAGKLTPKRLALIGRIAALRERRDRVAQLSRIGPCDWSYSCGLLWYRLDHILASKILTANQQLIAYDASSITDSILLGPPLAKSSSGEILSEVVANWKQAQVLMHDLGRGHGFKTFTFLQPSPFYGNKIFSPEEKTMLIKGTWPDTYTQQSYPSLQNAVRALQEEGYAAADLTGIFDSHPEQIYEDSCCHPQAHGEEIMAEAVAKEILKRW